MVILFILGSVIAFFIALILLIEDAKEHWRHIIFFIPFMFLWTIGLINQEPIKTTETTVIQNTWDGLKFDSIQEITYKQSYYNWWTYNYVSLDNDIYDVVIKDYEVKK